MKFQKTTLPNGLRIINISTPGNPAATVMVMVETGSNYESKSENGLSHFLEHMCFKGTEKRPSSKIVHRELDSLGAYSNAVTSNEYTGYYAKAEKIHWKKLLEIISDIYLNPILPQTDLDKERGVILQEISMYEDDPKSDIWDVLVKVMYGDTPAGRPTLGPAKNIKGFTKDDFVNYRNAHYVAKKTIITIAGDIKKDEIKKEVQKLFKEIPDKKKISLPKTKESQTKPAYIIKHKKTDQTHLALSFRTYPADDRRQLSLSLIATYLAGGFSSRLFEKLRDEMGACYYVHASNDRFIDHGIFSIVTGIEAMRFEEVVKVILAECKQMTENLISEDDLKRTKDFLVGSMYLHLETTDSLAEFYSIQEIQKGKIADPKTREKELRSITAKDIQKVAKEIFQNKHLNMAVIGDIKESKNISEILSF